MSTTADVPATRRPSSKTVRWLLIAAAIALVAPAFVFRATWLAAVANWSAKYKQDGDSSSAGESEHAGHDHAGHDHSGHDEGNSLELSDQARENIGLKVEKVTLRPFDRTVTVPGIVTERPARSNIQITAPMTGVVTRIWPILGQAVESGDQLFEMRLTHEELVQVQSEFLRSAEELDVIEQEIQRLTKVVEGGAVAGKVVLERKYEKQKQLAVQKSQHQSLLLHGLSEDQINAILTTRTLLQTLTIVAPTKGPEEGGGKATYQVQEMKVQKGQHVTAGDMLALVADHAELQIEGNAYETDLPSLASTIEHDWPVKAVFGTDSVNGRTVDGLKVLYLSGQVDPETRAFHFYVTLPNTLLRETLREGDKRFIYWEFKPGQRVQLLVPVEQWPDRIVLPVDAVAQDGLETYVFLPNGDHLDRRAVHVEYRDQTWAVIANDGSVFPGDFVAVNNAQQLQVALKNKSGGAIDPHAGHNH